MCKALAGVDLTGIHANSVRSLGGCKGTVSLTSIPPGGDSEKANRGTSCSRDGLRERVSRSVVREEPGRGRQDHQRGRLAREADQSAYDPPS
ncbi:hypothetical protein HPB50_004356 [Hyalomma asiaticum]|uniref:Uncharacterized protein n=1 Tax=Hyalomma asiaticum TaxID=266040 RepID=A0ACB7TC12_HYAAI|nr:hypothetical protein HPB50_004356 [Hyalomma asiaticum]